MYLSADVSILVLMEVTLKVSRYCHTARVARVSILVLMEVTLKDIIEKSCIAHQLFQSLF